MDDVWWGIMIHKFLSEPSVSLIHVDSNQQEIIWYTEPVDNCQIKANFKETSLFWFFTNQMCCTLIILLPVPVFAGFVAGLNSQVVFGTGYYLFFSFSQFIL